MIAKPFRFKAVKALSAVKQQQDTGCFVCFGSVIIALVWGAQFGNGLGVSHFCASPDCSAMNASMSAARHTVMRSDSLIGLGALFDATQAHHVDLLTLMRLSTCGKRKKAGSSLVGLFIFSTP